MNNILEQISKQKKRVERLSGFIQLEQETGNGNGFVMVKTGSHKQNRRFRESFSYAVTSAYGSFYYIPNTKEAIDEARKLGCTLAKHSKAFNNVYIDNFSEKEREVIMKNIKEKNVQFIFTPDSIKNYLEEATNSSAGNSLVSVIEEKNIIIVGNFHFHFSEYEPVKVISTVDESFQDTLYTFYGVTNLIASLLKPLESLQKL